MVSRSLSSSRWSKRAPACSLLLVLVFAFLLTACGGSNTASQDTAVKATVAAPANLIKAKKLVIGTEPSYLPMEYIDTKTNQYAGFDIDLARALAQRMGLELEVQKTSFDTLFDDLNNKRFDIVAASVTINPERQQKFDFLPYFKIGESLLVQKGNPKNIQNPADLCGLTVGVQIGTVEQDSLNTASTGCTSKGKPAINQIVLKSQTDVINLLVTKRADATYQDSPISDYYNKQNPGQFEVAGSVINASPAGLVIRKGDTEMMNAMQKAFVAMQADGSYNQLFEKWNFSAEQKVS